MTARHVIEGTTRITNKITVRLNDRSGNWIDKIYDRSEWFFHADENIDVAVCPTNLRKSDYSILHCPTDGNILNKSVLNYYNIGIGDEVNVAGLFRHDLSPSRNIPVIRTGTIAAMPHGRIRTTHGYQESFLIEIRSIEGLSGSPVSVGIPPLRDVRLPTGPIPHLFGAAPDYVPPNRGESAPYLVGMMLGAFEVSRPSDSMQFVSDSSSSTETQPPPSGYSINTGLAAVLPTESIIEAVEQPEVKAARKEMVDLYTDERPLGPTAD
ncbi:MAG: hypothetical protein WDN69_01170 [Aliidongia sp.]